MRAVFGKRRIRPTRSAATHSYLDETYPRIKATLVGWAGNAGLDAAMTGSALLI
jgi:hypothetical protein